MNAISPQSGMSLVEIIVIVLIIGILVTLAIPQFNRANVSFTRQNAAQQLKVFLDRARFDSIKRHAKASDEMASVTINNPTSFTLLTDQNADGILQTTEARHLSFAGKSNIKITGAGLVFPITISFDYRGQVITTDGNDSVITPNFVFCEGNATYQTASTENSSTVVLSKTGTSSVVTGKYTLPTINRPNVSNIKTDTKIKQTVTVSNSVYMD